MVFQCVPAKIGGIMRQKPSNSIPFTPIEGSQQIDNTLGTY